MEETEVSGENRSSEIVRFDIRNFKSIKHASMKFSPFTILYGGNGTGKSSVLYALLTLKNVVLNPNQNVNSFFTYPFLNAGGYENVVFDHKKKESISFSVESVTSDFIVNYTVEIDEGRVNFKAKVSQLTDNSKQFNLELSSPLPYPLNQQKTCNVNFQKKGNFTVSWNGLLFSPVGTITPEHRNELDELIRQLNTSVEAIRRTGVVPLKRGFSKPLYSAGASVTGPVTEEDISTLLINNKYLVSRISHYIEQIFDRDFRVNFKPGTGFFSFDVSDKRTGMATELINDGFGINQIVHLLSISLYDDYDLILIEEPEIHLNPASIRKVLAVLIDISKRKDKRFVITTHSESFISSLLTSVSKGLLKVDDVSVYFAEKENDVSKFSKQTVNEKGQIEGGLEHFVKSELEDLRSLLGIEN